jgi:2-keto-4-pentenoate hydratase/2-oxohepta-3-ene-1,7-dioic acid hydratase in catechol pathway
MASTRRATSSGILLSALTAVAVFGSSVATGLAQQSQQQQQLVQQQIQAGASTFRLLTFESGTSGPRLGTTRGNGDEDIVDVHNAVLYLLRSGAPEAAKLGYIPIDMRSLVEAGAPSIAAVKNLHQTITALKASGKFQEPGGTHRVFHPPSGVEYHPPLLNPSKIFGLAGNYIRKTPDGKPGAFDFVEYPSAFLKPPSAQIGHNHEINLEGLLTTGVHEPEMAVIIGKRATNVPESQAMDYVMGYTVHNDVSSRDLKQGQHNSQGSTISKGLDTFAPAGPYITLKEDVPNPHNLAISGVVNGKPWPIPNANTSYLTFNVPQLIAYLSERVTLEAGDIIATGVPGPVMVFEEGDVVELTIGHLGTLRNTVVSKPVPGHKFFPPRTVAPMPTRSSQ